LSRLPLVFIMPFVRAETFGNDNVRLRAKIVGVLTLLVATNLMAWIWAVVVFHPFPILLGLALLAYSFGLRHAVDADHIAAIDNVTRKLMQNGERPVGVGLFFSLGHSTVVIGLSIALAATASALQSHFDILREVGGFIGTSVSAIFLFLIAAANTLIFISVCRTFQAVKGGGQLIEGDLDVALAKRGGMGRMFRRLFRLISRSWHMYPLGFLFGLGFDTASEVGLLGISATEAARDLSLWSILIFPVLFTAGMLLVDTTDSILMLGAYGWAFVKPIRKLYYNLTITFVSVVVAVIVGGIEALGLVAGKLCWKGPFWDAIGSLNDNFSILGYLTIGIFVASWLVALMIYRIRRYDEIEVNPE
jgi:high-affinity nickel-transport protein